MVAAACELGAEVVGTLHAVASPWGDIDSETYDDLKGLLLDAIRSAMPLDAVALDLHGAAVAVGAEDLEGDLCRAVRDVIGPDTKLVVTHDLHGNITADEAAAVDVMFGVHHYPHDDMYERGREAVEAVPRLLSGEWRPAIHVERLPMLVPTTTTYSGVGAEVLQICQDLERRDGVLDCTFMHGFPYTDNPLVGSQVVVMTKGDRALAERTAREAAEQVWARREQFIVRHPQPAEAVRQALELPGRPIVVNETSDNPGGGTPCDGTHLLRALLDARPHDAVFVGIKDPEVVDQAHEAGVGAVIDIKLGGKTDSLHGTSIACTAYVRTLTDGNVTLEAPMGGGSVLRLGRTAGLVIDGVDVIVISRGEQTFDRTPLVLHGIDPLTRKIVALKSSHHFRSGFQELAAGIVTTDPPGLTTLQLEQLPKKRSPRPIFPLDPDARYPLPSS
jgi:microcystin degradation protein MlrC